MLTQEEAVEIKILMRRGAGIREMVRGKQMQVDFTASAAVGIPYSHLSPHWVTAGPVGFALPAINVPIRCAPVLSGHLDILVACPGTSV